LPKSLALLGRGFFLAFFCYSKNGIDANFLFFLVFVSAHYSASIRHSSGATNTRLRQQQRPDFICPAKGLTG
jgi:hypothetical protein